MTKKIWLQEAGNAYYSRNKKDMGKGIDLVTTAIDLLGIRPEGKLLEIGCANGWRLDILHKRGFDVYGIDPSADAIIDARNVVEGTFFIGTADNLRALHDEFFSVVILGFCMFMIDPEYWFSVVAETDRVLMDKGVLIIHDYVFPRPLRFDEWGGDVSEVEKTVSTYCYEFPKLWYGHPWYKRIGETMGERVMGKWKALEAATCLFKNKDEILGSKVQNS